jgi:hypothetical protein
LIIAILFQKLVEGGPVAGGILELELQAEGGKKAEDFGEAKLAEAAVFEGVEGGASDAGPFCERGLAYPEGFATGGDPCGYAGEGEHIWRLYC